MRNYFQLFAPVEVFSKNKTVHIDVRGTKQLAHQARRVTLHVSAEDSVAALSRHPNQEPSRSKAAQSGVIMTNSTSHNEVCFNIFNVVITETMYVYMSGDNSDTPIHCIDRFRSEIEDNGVTADSFWNWYIELDNAQALVAPAYVANKAEHAEYVADTADDSDWEDTHSSLQAYVDAEMSDVWDIEAVTSDIAESIVNYLA